MIPESNPHSPASERYSRQILFAPIGPPGQERIRHANVAVVGCGAIGASSCTLLARAGVGTLRIIDRDYVESSNLQRQSLFDEADAAESIPKAIAAVRKIAAFNSDVQAKAEVAAFRATLQQLGWTEGRNLRTELRWAGGTVKQLYPTHLRLG